MKISKTSIAQTFENLTPFVRRTPIIDIEVPGIEMPVVLKLEHMQHSGSFKARGAFANLLGAKVPESGVAAASGGNHGAAVAYVAQALGLPARVFVPEISVPAKISRIKSYGAEVVVDGENYSAALANCQKFLDQSGALSLHAYDAPTTIVGQGTMAAELETQVFDGIDTLLMAVGGGGLIGGAAAWHEGAVKLVGVEPHGCATLHSALAAGKPVPITPGGLAADSLGASMIGELMFPLAQKYISGVVLVSDDDIASAQMWLWENLRIVTEPGGATAFASLLSGAYEPVDGERIAVVICGGNTDVQNFGAKAVRE